MNEVSKPVIQSQERTSCSRTQQLVQDLGIAIAARNQQKAATETRQLLSRALALMVQ